MDYFTQDELVDIADFFKNFADVTRLRILFLLLAPQILIFLNIHPHFIRKLFIHSIHLSTLNGNCFFINIGRFKSGQHPCHNRLRIFIDFLRQQMGIFCFKFKTNRRLFIQLFLFRLTFFRIIIKRF